MSMNIFIEAVRPNNSNAKPVVFDAVQTTTTETYAILDSDNQMLAYRNLLLERSRRIHRVWQANGRTVGPDDDWPIEHLAVFDHWCETMTAQGYTLVFSMI